LNLSESPGREAASVSSLVPVGRNCRYGITVGERSEVAGREEGVWEERVVGVEDRDSRRDCRREREESWREEAGDGGRKEAERRAAARWMGKEEERARLREEGRSLWADDVENMEARWMG
jgi:hypothetical protein